MPAFSGLFAPHWRPDARGAIVGLTRFVNKGHLARAALEATAYQTREVIDAMNADSGVELTALKVDGGMVVNELLMQFQADILGVPVIRPVVTETTALGAAYAAGLAVGFWEARGRHPPELGRGQAAGSRPWTTTERGRLYAQWKKAVDRTYDWVEMTLGGSAAREWLWSPRLHNFAVLSLIQVVVPHQLPAGLGDRAGQRRVDREGVGQLVDGELVLHGQRDRQDQLAGARARPRRRRSRRRSPGGRTA